MIFLCILGFLYFLPTIIAFNRGHEVAGVLLLNLFLGWTGVGWIALLLWALLSWAPYAVYGPPLGTYSGQPVNYKPPVSYYYPRSFWRL